MAWVADRVSPHKRIRQLEFVPQIPKSPSGKILRRLLVDGAPALLQTDVHPVVGCTFTPVVYTPCVTIRWVTGATQTKVRGVPVLLGVLKTLT